MNYVLVTVSKGLVEEVTFFRELQPAVDSLKKYVEGMNVENNDAAVYAPDGLIMSAEEILDEIEASEETEPEMVKTAPSSKPVYIIGDADHDRLLSSMVTSTDDPIGFDNPIEAISQFGQIRALTRRHLRLYKVIPVQGPLVTRKNLEAYNVEALVENFQYDMVEEHIKS